MAISQAMWSHGHSIQPEDPTLTVGRVGWAGQIRHPGSRGWYHIPTGHYLDIRRMDAALIFQPGLRALYRTHV
jgi:hypothetical protein